MKAALRLFPFLTALCACEQVIEPDLPEHPPRLVLQAFFTSDGAWTAHVARSFGILEPQSVHGGSLVDDAAVELLAGDRVVGKLEFNYTVVAYVFEGGALQAGETYSLRVTAPGFETVRATDTVPGPVPTSVRLYRPRASAGSESGAGRDLSIELEIQDPPGEANYYQISLFRVYEGREEGEARDFIPAFRREENFSTKDPSILADNSVDGSPFEEGGFEGKAPYFRDTLFDGSTHEIELSTDFAGGPDFSEIRLQVLYISEAYYEYLKTARLHHDTLDNPFAEPLNVYSNVENGYGIFAGYSSQTFELAGE